MEGEFRLTSPNAIVVAFTLSVATAALSCSEKVSEVVPALAVRVTACAELTDDTVAEKLALVAAAATVTEAGTVTAELVLDRFTINPPLAAAVLSVTVQASVPALVMDELVQDIAVSTGTPTPLRLTTVGEPVDELLAKDN